MKTSIPGPRLRQLLAEADLTQAQVARALHVDPGQVSRWCHDRATLRGRYAGEVVALLRGRGMDVELPAAGCRVFLSTPMAALDSTSYETDRAQAEAVYGELCKIADPVYWPPAQIKSAAEFEAPDLATEHNLVALAEAEAFVYLQLRTLDHPTSCHVELGIAIARGTPVTVFAPSEDALPYTLRHFGPISERGGFGGRYRFYPIGTAADAVRLLTIHGPELLGLLPARPAPARPVARQR